MRRKQWPHDRPKAGKAAAPFYHSKLVTIEHAGEVGGDMKHVHLMQVEFVDSKRSQ